MNDEHGKPRETEQGVRKGSRKALEPSTAYSAGVESAQVLLDVLETGIATHGAMHQSLNTVLLRGQADELRGWCAALQERLEPHDEEL